MNQPRRPKNHVTPIDPGHWYSTTSPRTDRAPRAVPLDPPEKPPSRVRNRVTRRSSGSPQWTFEVRWIHLVIGAALIGIVGVITLSLFAATRANSGSSPTIAPILSANNGSGVMPNRGLTAVPTINVQPWDGKNRYTVLLLGLDQRPGEVQSDSRTDVMIVLSIDPSTHSAGMLSLPRDLFVPIPGQSDLQRVNSAFELGELKEPGSGPQLAMQTVQYNLGIRIDHYVVFNFQAVTALIDAVGGVDIDVPQAINDPQFPDMNYGFDPLYIPAGHIHMDGTKALKYARTRHGDSDFERTHRQQQVILAVRDKVTKLNMLPQLVQQAPQLWSQLQGSVLTNLTLDQALGLAVYAKDIPFASIQHGTIEGQYARAMPWQGDTVVSPDRGKIGDLMKQIFGATYDR